LKSLNENTASFVSLITLIMRSMPPNMSEALRKTKAEVLIPTMGF